MGKEARLVATPLGCQSVPEAGQAATVRWHGLGRRGEQRGFGRGGNGALWWLRSQPTFPLGRVLRAGLGSPLLSLFLAAPGSACV